MKHETTIAEVEEKARAARSAAHALATVGTAAKNAALQAMAEALGERCNEVLDANARDTTAAKDRGLSPHLIDRLTLNPKRVDAMRAGLAEVAALPDPIGTVVDGWRRPNGLQINKVRVPLGVIGIIYESRPNVTVDAAALCLKSGNATLLRGGSEAIHSNTALARICAQAAREAGVPEASLQLIETTDRAAVPTLARADGLLDVLVLRGGERLKKSVLEVATVPVLCSLGGNCHVYVDAAADPTMASDITFNAKVNKPSVCNAAETLLVHEAAAPSLLPDLIGRLQNAGVEVHGCPRTREIVGGHLAPATEEDYLTEYNALILAVRVISSLDEAIAHINRYGTRHSEAIVTGDYAAAQRFCDEVDAAAVYVNASTRFTDGYEFGFGAEIGISNQKLHARGPMGLEELTTIKYVVRGDGQVRE